MRTCLLILLTIYYNGFVSAQEDSGSFVLLELFTSQGCSSCPPADLLLDQVQRKYTERNVFVMSYHVDYWNRLGWKDPFSKEEYSIYQREYAVQLRSRSIYTPQVVVNGKEHFTGSDSVKMTQALMKYGDSEPKHEIIFKDISTDNGQVKIAYTINGQMFDRITFVLLIDKRVTSVNRGENRNRTLKNSNIVVNRLVKRTSEGNIVLSIPDWIINDDELSVIAYTQKKSLEITGVLKKVLKM